MSANPELTPKDVIRNIARSPLAHPLIRVFKHYTNKDHYVAYSPNCLVSDFEINKFPKGRSNIGYWENYSFVLLGDDQSTKLSLHQNTAISEDAGRWRHQNIPDDQIPFQLSPVVHFNAGIIEVGRQLSYGFDLKFLQRSYDEWKDQYKHPHVTEIVDRYRQYERQFLNAGPQFPRWNRGDPTPDLAALFEPDWGFARFIRKIIGR